MCKTGNSIAPTRHGVYLRKTNKSKSVRAEAVTRLVLRGSSSSKGSTEEANHSNHKYVYRCKSSSDGQKQGKKQGKCACGGNCDKDSSKTKWHFHCDAKAPNEKRKKSKKTGFLHVKAKFGECCHCSGVDDDGWLCDVCRAADKKKGMLKFVARDSSSEGSSGCSQDCDESSSDCDCDDDDEHTTTECESWMVAAVKKRKNEQKEKVGCSCHRPGCKACVIINC